MNKNSISRCAWADKFPEMQLYHDTEWGVPVHQDAKLFEFLVLEGAQAGLSWSTILKRRQDYRRAFDNFDVKRVAEFEILLYLLVVEGGNNILNVYINGNYLQT